MQVLGAGRRHRLEAAPGSAQGVLPASDRPCRVGCDQRWARLVLDISSSPLSCRNQSPRVVWERCWAALSRGAQEDSGVLVFGFSFWPCAPLPRC